MTSRLTSLSPSSASNTKEPLETADEESQGLLYSNLMGCHNVDKAAILYMENAGIRGKICNTASFTGRRSFDGFFHYGMTKAAILYLTQAYAYTAAPWGLNVNAVNPDIIRTKMWNRILDEAEASGLEGEAAWADYQKKYIPQGHAQTPEDIACGTVFLCSGYANDITGQALALTVAVPWGSNHLIGGYYDQNCC